jgi:hypothetical protein
MDDAGMVEPTRSAVTTSEVIVIGFSAGGSLEPGAGIASALYAVAAAVSRIVRTKNAERTAVP